MDDGSVDCEESDGDHSPGFCRTVLERDRIFESLGHVRRRYLCYLLCADSELQVDEAVAAIADWEHDDGSAPESHRERVRLSLLHSHIPKLRSADVVDFDPHSETLETDDAEAVLSALRAVGDGLCPEPDGADDGSDAR